MKLKKLAHKTCLKIARRTGSERAVWISLPNKCSLLSPDLNPEDYQVKGMLDVYHADTVHNRR